MYNNDRSTPVMGQAQENRQGEVTESVMRLDALANDVRSRVKLLHERLSPVLSMDDEKTPQLAGGSVSPVKTAIGKHMLETIYCITETINELEDIARRLEV